MYYIREKDVVFWRWHCFDIFEQCDVPGDEDHKVTIFLTVTLIHKTKQANFIQVLHSKPGRKMKCGILINLMIMRKSVMFFITNNFLIHLTKECSVIYVYMYIFLCLFTFWCHYSTSQKTQTFLDVGKNTVTWQHVICWCWC